jgi:HAD superfamily hydrolase (TIGR01549 family)
MKYKTVLFDLDDTIFDHQYSRRCALAKLNEHYKLTSISMKDFEKIHDYYLNLTYNKVLEKKISLDDSRKKRITLLFNHFGCKIKISELHKADSIYREEYNLKRRSIPNVNNLIKRIKSIMKVCIITNGLCKEQLVKISICGVKDYIDFCIISEEIGCKKPEKEFYYKTLEILNNKNDECIAIGDSWETDIIGANRMEIDSIWLNRYEKECPNPKITKEINSYDNIENIMRLME